MANSQIAPRFEKLMNLRRILLDVDKGLNRPTLTELAGSIEEVPGVDAVKITVTEMDMETMGTSITVEGLNINYNYLVKVIEDMGCAIHSIDEVITGKHIIK